MIALLPDPGNGIAEKVRHRHIIECVTSRLIIDISITSQGGGLLPDKASNAYAGFSTHGYRD